MIRKLFSLLGIAGVLACSVCTLDAALSQEVGQQRRVEATAAGLLCRRLSRLGEGTVTADPNVADFRVTWNYSRSLPLMPALGRLAELTDSQIVTVGDAAAKRYVLRRRAATVRLENEWRVAPRLEGIRRLRESGDPSYKNNEISELALTFLRTLSPAALYLIAEGEEVRLSEDSLSKSQRRKLVEALVEWIYSDQPNHSKTAGRTYMEGVLNSEGVGLVFAGAQEPPSEYLMIRVGELNSRGARVIGRIRDDRPELPLSRANPYRQLESLGRKLLGPPRPAPLPAAAQQPLPRDLVLPVDGRWRSALQAVSEATGIDVVSDDYLTRAASTLSSVKPGTVVAPRGTPLVTALDQLCRRFGYLWWTRSGAYYFRSRTWAYDAACEPPDAAIRQVDGALSRRSSLSQRDFEVLSTLTARQWEGLQRLGKTRASISFQGSPRELTACFQRLSTPQWVALVRGGLVVRPADDPWLRRIAGVQTHPVQLGLSQRVRREASPLGPVWRIELFPVTRVGNKEASPSTAYTFSLPRMNAGDA